MLYVTEDGKRFKTEAEALKHEADIKEKTKTKDARKAEIEQTFRVIDKFEKETDEELDKLYKKTHDLIEAYEKDFHCEYDGYAGKDVDIEDLFRRLIDLM